MPFEAIVLGVGDTFSDRHYTTALLLTCDGATLAIDCPDRYRAVLRDAATKSSRSIDLASIDRVLITHVHGDHMNGLEGVAFFKHFVEGKRLGLVTTKEVRDVIWEQRLVATMSQLWDGAAFRTLGFDDYFDYQELSWSGVNQVGPFAIEIRRTRHHVPTCALRIRAGGRTLGYSSDTAFDPSLIEFLAPADLIIHETNFGPAHTAYADLAALPPPLRARMRLIHYSDLFDVAGSNIAPLVEGEVLVI